jgi:DNA-binding MarR family transcriptional regulator
MIADYQNRKDMENPVFWIKRAYLSMHKYLDEYLQEYEITAAQLDVLMYLWHEDGMEHRVLMERLGVSSPSLTSVIDVMVERGYVERRVSPDDARVKQIFMTPRGWELSSLLAEKIPDINAQLLATFSSTESMLFVDWLKKVSKNMGDTYHPSGKS